MQEESSLMENSDPDKCLMQQSKKEVLDYLEIRTPHFPKYSFEELSQLEDVKLKKYKNCVYFGQVLNHRKNGRGQRVNCFIFFLGILLYSQNRFFEGHFVDDKKEGHECYELFTNGSYFVGSYVQGRVNGQGKYVWPNGDFYEGGWKDGLKDGKGRWQGQRGDFYEGEWVQGKVEGKGVHQWINGTRYEGYFKDCLKFGFGKEYFANGDIYVGNYHNGKPDGYGQYNWINGVMFQGQFRNGLRYGQGVSIEKQNGNTVIYKGEYVNDKKCGFGLYKWSNGCVYKGTFMDNFMHGQGTLKFKDGRMIKSDWQMGKMIHNENDSTELFRPEKPYFTRPSLLLKSQMDDDISNDAKETIKTEESGDKTSYLKFRNIVNCMGYKKKNEKTQGQQGQQCANIIFRRQIDF